MDGDHRHNEGHVTLNKQVNPILVFIFETNFFCEVSIRNVPCPIQRAT